MTTANERIRAQRAEASRLLDAATERLVEVLSDYAVPASVDDTTREKAAFVLGWEGDGDDDEGAGETQ